MTSDRAVARRERIALIAVLVLAAGFRLWHLQQNGYSNAYYAAAVRSMLQSLHNFFYVSFDPAGFVSIDKPPVALWFQALSAQLLGYHGLSLILPQALAGVGACWLIYLLVRGAFGGTAGLLAAFVLAVTPISVATDRTNNMDSVLVLTLLLAACALLRAVETGRIRPLVLTALLLSVAFNVKMLAAFVVLPTFALLYWFACRLDWRQRLAHLAIATSVLIPVSLSWAMAVDLTPKAQRPYVGSSANNSALGLIVGYNGIGRLSGQEGNFPGGRFPGGGGPGRGGFPMPPGIPGGPKVGPPGGPFGGHPGGPMGMMMAFGGRPGPLRLAQTGLSDQITWLFPLAAMGLFLTLSRSRRRFPLTPQAQQRLLWTGWLGTYALVYSLAKGIMHPYYLVTLAPALAALTGISVVTLWAEYRQGGWRAWLLPLALLLTAIWEGRILRDYPDWSRILLPLLLVGTLIAAVGLILASAATTKAATWQRVALGMLALGVLAQLISPTSWAMTAVIAPGNSVIPSAGPQLLSRNGFGPPGPMGGMERMDTDRLLAFLRQHRHGERYLLMTGELQFAAQIIIKTGEPVVAMGGFTGGDPILTSERFAALVKAGQVRYVLTGGMGMIRGGNADVMRWVRAHGKLVPASQWQSDSADLDVSDLLLPFGGPGGRMAMMQLYDCAPNASDNAVRSRTFRSRRFRL